MEKTSVTLEDIRDAITEAVKNFEGVDVTTLKSQEAIDKIAKQKMAELVDMLLYINEDPDVEQLGYDLYVDEENKETE